jgi:hypothetical protein
LASALRCQVILTRKRQSPKIMRFSRRFSPRRSVAWKSG